MRRRNAKMVTFAAPTYREASEIEWSESESDSGEMQVVQTHGAEQQQQEAVNYAVHSNGQLNDQQGNGSPIATAIQPIPSTEQYELESGDQQGMSLTLFTYKSFTNMT